MADIAESMLITDQRPECSAKAKLSTPLWQHHAAMELETLVTLIMGLIRLNGLPSLQGCLGRGMMSTYNYLAPHNCFIQ